MGTDLEITGIRKAEGGIRSANYKTCFSESKSKGCNTYRPIFWYTDSDKRDYEQFYEIEHSRCYTEYGLKRTGCVGCPFSKHINEELAVIEKYEPDLYKAAIHIFRKSYEYTAKYREFQKMMKEKERNKCIRACSVSFYVRMFEHNFVVNKEKVRRNTDVLQGFLTQSTAKFAEKTCEKRY